MSAAPATARALVRRVRRELVAALVLRAAAYGALALLGVPALAALLARAIPDLAGWRGAAWALGAVLAVVLAALTLWRARGVFSMSRVALWIEERVGALRFALVTALDARTDAGTRAALERRIASLDPERLTRGARRRVGASAAVALVLAIASALVLARVPTPRARAARDSHRASPLESRIARIDATVTPPAYARLPAARLRDPTTIAALAGSRVVVEGQGAANGLAATLGASALGVREEDDRWRVAFALPESATVLRLADPRAARGPASRLVVLAPRRDEPPVVRLLAPARDTTVRSAAALVLDLDAELADDIGLASARFEYIVASGDREGSYTFRQGTLAARAVDGARSARLRARLPLSTLSLGPGDRISLRAVAADGRDDRARGEGFSETRIVRVARPGEYDSLAVTAAAAPPPVAERLVSLQMLVMRAESLHVARAALPAAEYRRRSERLGGDGIEITGRLDELIDQQSDGGALAVDPRLSRAGDALREGTRALLAARTGEALPPLRVALLELERFRLASRYYLRGRPPEVVVNVERVRLAGRDTARALPREPREMADRVRRLAQRRATLAAVVGRMRSDPLAAADALAVLRAASLGDAPAFAAALDEAEQALRARRDAVPALARARREIDGAVVRLDSLPAWSGAR